MKSVFALSALLFAQAIFAQDSLSSVSTPSASPTESLVSVTTSDSANLASPTSDSISVTITESSSSASHTGSAKAKGTSSAPKAAATGSSYKIPSGISSGCSNFLKALDENTEFGTCTAPLLTATSNFGPGSNATQSQDALVATLDKLCSATGCSDKLIRTQLTNFASACKAELDPSTGNASVRDAYDILYVMQPWQDSICLKDNGSYCVLKAPSKSSTSSSSSDDKTGAVVNAVVDDGTDADLVNDAVEEFYAKGVNSVSRKRAEQTVYSPDTETYRESGVMYLYTLPSLSAESLCTPCTQKMLSAYASWEATVPYAAGLANSPMLGGQSDLWDATKKKCGDSFMNVVTASVGTANAEVNAATQVGVSSAVAGVFAVAMGFVVAL
ncbi:hypothetical protein FRC01_002826 [Tulasnella sp. 417]|nr:hypothetical protein FRC01_002826 [Tulasnella sp. 417]